MKLNICQNCFRPLPQARRGRPARYCGPACRQRAYRLRRRYLAAALGRERSAARWLDYRRPFPTKPYKT